MEILKAQILDKLNTGVLLLKVPPGATHVKDYIFLYENETACKDVDREYPSQYIGKTFGEIYPNFIRDFPGLVDVYPEVMKTGKTRVIQPIKYGSQDNIKDGDWGFTVIKVDEEHVVIIYRNVQDELRIRSVIESNLCKTRFLSHISHELRTPMNTIDGMTKLLLKILQDKNSVDIDNLQKYAECIKNSSKIMINLISDLIDTSAIEEERIEIRLSCNDIAQSVRETIENIKILIKKNISIDYHVTNIPILYCDADRIQQIVYNLVSNSIKFTSQGVVMVNLDYTDSNLILNIKDTGEGIKNEDIPHIFDRFYRSTDTNQPGSGLGLWIVKKLVELQKGNIKVNSVVGLGTMFTVSIPLIKYEDDNTNSNKIMIKESLKKRDQTNNIPILLVEDNYNNQLLMKEIFKIYKLEYDIANNGQEALKKLRANNYNYSCILMDCYMPIMNGYECTLEIRRENTSIGIIGLTASVINGKNKCMQVGMNDFIAKPIDINELMLKLEKYI